MKKWINDHFDEHLALLKTLAAIPAPSGREDARVAFILEWCRDNGIDAYADEAKNVVMPVGQELPGKMTVFSAHTDVVFPDLDPLPVREEDGRLYAPGVGDDTANAAAILTILRYLKETGLIEGPSEPLLFVLNSCEEGLGNLKGTRRLFKDHDGKIKALISFDCSFEEGMVVRAVGSERWRVTARTGGGHSYFDFGEPNAIHELSKLISELYRQEVPASNGKTTYNVGMISGGTSVNTIAESAEMLYEYRSEDGEALRIMRESFKKLAAGFECELIGERPCGCSVDEEEQNALIELCRKEAEAILGRRLPLRSASTDANIPLSMGIPAVTFGLFSGEGAHTRGEWLDIGSLKTGLEIGLGLIAKYFMTDTGNPPKIKAVLFDLDGTLINTEIYFFRAWTSAAAHYGMTLTREMALKMRSLGRPFAAEQFREWFGEDCPFSETAKLCGELFTQLAEKYGIFLKPGVEELLKWLKERGITVALTTSQRTEKAELLLKKAGIYRYFDRIICSNMVALGKPAPDTYLLACRELGLEPVSALAVEDSPNGIRSAYSAGCRVVMVPDMSEPDEELNKMLFASVRMIDGISRLEGLF